MTVFDDFDSGAESVRLLKIYPKRIPFLADLEVLETSPLYIYSIDLFGQGVRSVFIEEIYNAVSSYAALSDKTYFFDRLADKLYIGKDTAIPSSSVIEIIYILCFASFDTNQPLDPQDALSDAVFYEGRLISTPSLRKGLDQDVSGFIPSFSSSINIDNADDAFSYLLNASETSLVNSSLELFLASRPVDTTKVIKIFEGFITGIKMSDSNISISFSDVLDLFKANIPLLTGNNVVTKELYPNVADTNLNFNIREVYGRKDFIRCLNVDADKVASPKNPEWIICKNFAQSEISPNFTIQVLASPAPTTTRFYFTITSAFTQIDPQPGDIMHALTAGSGATEIEVTAFNRASGFIDYLPVAAAPQVGKQFRRDRIGNLWAYRQIDGVYVRQTFVSRGVGSAHVLRGDVSLDSTNRLIKLTITSDATNILNASDVDIVVARVYGEGTLPEVGSSPRSLDTGSFSRWHHEILKILTRRAGVPVSLIDEDAVDDLNADFANQEDVAFTLPFDFSSQMPNIRDVIALITNSVNAQVFTNTQGVFTFKKIEPPNSATPTLITKDDILGGSFDYDLSFKDLLLDMLFKYKREDFKQVTQTRLIESQDGFELYRETFSDEGKRYASKSTTEKQSLCFKLDDVEANALKQRAIYAYPIGIISLDLPLSFAGTKIGDTFKIERDIIPSAGQDILADVISINITQNSVQLSLWDKRGIIQNIGDF